MLPSPWRAPPAHSRSPETSASIKTVVPRGVRLHDEYRKSGGMRPQSQAAVVLLGHDEASSAAQSGASDDDFVAGNSSRFSTYTREEVKKLGEPGSSGGDS